MVDELKARLNGHNLVIAGVFTFVQLVVLAFVSLASGSLPANMRTVVLGLLVALLYLDNLGAIMMGQGLLMRWLANKLDKATIKASGGVVAAGNELGGGAEDGFRR